MRDRQREVPGRFTGVLLIGHWIEGENVPHPPLSDRLTGSGGSLVETCAQLFSHNTDVLAHNESLVTS